MVLGPGDTLAGSGKSSRTLLHVLSLQRVSCWEIVSCSLILMPFVNFHSPYLHTDVHSLLPIAHTIARGLITAFSVFLSTHKRSACELL